MVHVLISKPKHRVVRCLDGIDPDDPSLEHFLCYGLCLNRPKWMGSQSFCVNADAPSNMTYMSSVLCARHVPLVDVSIEGSHMMEHSNYTDSSLLTHPISKCHY